MPLPVNDSNSPPSHAADDTDIDEDRSLGSFTLDAALPGQDVGTVVSQRRIGLHR